MYYFVMFMCLLKFATHEVMAKISSVMLVNDQVINVHLTDKQYRGEYTYVDGELAKFTCIRDNTIYHQHNITYHDKENQYNFRGINNNITSLYIKLKKENSPEYIDCIVEDMFNTTRNMTINVTLKNEIKNYPKFKVNRLLLSPLIPRTEYGLLYSYEYYFGEELNISFDFSGYLNSIGCSSSDTIINENVKDISKTSLNVTLNTEKFVDLHLNASSFKCSVRLDQTYYDIELKLVRNRYGKPYTQMSGISLSRVISRVSNSTTIRDKVFYTYYDNETLVLNCSMKGNAKWKFNENEVTDTPLDGTSASIDARIFELNDNINSSVLLCMNTKALKDHEHSEIVLVRSEYIKEDSVPVTTTTPVSAASTNANDINDDGTGIDKAYTSTSVSPLPNKQDESTENYGGLDPKMFYIIIGAVVSVIIIAMILITLIVCKLKKKVHQKAESDINYENLPEHNEGSMPLPSQWNNEYANSTEMLYNNVNNEPTYAKPIPKSVRNKLNDTYSVPQTSNDTSYEYATPYNANSESPYAEIIPPSQRNREPKLKPNPENVNYAQVIPKSQRNNVNLSKVLPTINDYSEIDPIRTRANTDKNKYANVFDKERYVNAKSSDYIEPAYASIDSLK